jgi:hypothetical protein
MLIRVVALKFSVCPFRTCPLYNVVPFESETNNHEFPRTAETLTETPVPEEYVSRTVVGMAVESGVGAASLGSDGCAVADSEATTSGVLTVVVSELEIII